MISLLNFIKIYKLVQKLLVEDTQKDRQTGDVISPLSFLKESTLHTGITITLKYFEYTDRNSSLVFFHVG
jgi:hypothetical protein